MRTDEVYATLVDLGLLLRPLNGKLWVEPRDRITPDARRLIVENRDSLLDMLLRRSQAALVPPCPATVAERAALIEHGDGCDRAESERRTLAEAGFGPWDELAEAHALLIRAALKRLPAQTTDAGTRLCAVSVKFLDTDHWQQAVSLGWSLIELFGLSPNAPLVRVDGQGLVSGLALSCHAGGRLENLVADHATIRQRSGSVLTWRRGMPSLDAAVLWWECPAIVGSKVGP